MNSIIAKYSCVFAAEDETGADEAPAANTDTKPAKSKKSAKKSSKKDVKAKADKPAKKSAEKPTKAKALVERDQFGFRKDSKKAKAAAMYSSKKGATLAEVKDKIGSSQLNLLTELEGRVKVEKTKEKGAGKKQVTRYKIIVPEGGVKAAKPKKDDAPAKAKNNGKSAKAEKKGGEKTKKVASKKGGEKPKAEAAAS